MSSSTSSLGSSELIVFEDRSLLVLNKPSCLHSVSQKKNDASLASWLLEKFPKLAEVAPRQLDGGLVQRLDFETSGLLIAAKTAAVWNALHQAIRNAEVKKTYLAVVGGSFQRELKISGFIGAASRGAKKVRNYKTKKPRTEWGETVFSPLKSSKKANCSLVQAQASPARRHQVRLHAAALGFPLIGDNLYGSLVDVGAHGDGDAAGFLLHAASIELCHPESGQRLYFEVAPPWEFDAIVEKLLSK